VVAPASVTVTVVVPFHVAYPVTTPEEVAVAVPAFPVVSVTVFVTVAE
jgi:hypothetical protein